jgi:hypothetical protein
LFIAATLSLTASICIDQPVRSSVGALVILAGSVLLPLAPAATEHQGARDAAAMITMNRIPFTHR